MTAENMRDARAPWLGDSAVGPVIASADIADDQRVALWGAAQHMVSVWSAYYRATGMPGRHAKCLSILTPPDTMHADAASAPIDVRSEAERYTGAVAAMMRVEGYLGRISAVAALECKRVVLDDAACFDPAGVLAGLRAVSDGIAGRQG